MEGRNEEGEELNEGNGRKEEERVIIRVYIYLLYS